MIKYLDDNEPFHDHSNKLDMDRHQANRWDVLFVKSTAPKPEPKVSFIDNFFRKYYAPFLMNDLIGFAIICRFKYIKLS